MIGAAERLAEPGRRIRADSQEPVSQAGLAQVPYPVQALADSDSHRRRLCLAGQCGEFLDQLVSLGVRGWRRWLLVPPGTAGRR